MSKTKLFIFSLQYVYFLAISFSGCTQTTPKDKNVNLVAGSSISAEDLRSRIEAGLDGVLLDLRTPTEVANGILPGATVIDFQQPDFKSKIDQLDRDETYYIYCHAGGRSANALTLMQQMGFSSVVEYAGGFKDWTAKGYPLVKVQ